MESRHSLANAETKTAIHQTFFRGKKTPAGLMVLAGSTKIRRRGGTLTTPNVAQLVDHSLNPLICGGFRRSNTVFISLFSDLLNKADWIMAVPRRVVEFNQAAFIVSSLS